MRVLTSLPSDDNGENSNTIGWTPPSAPAVVASGRRLSECPLNVKPRGMEC